MNSGIYCIFCVKARKRYIGSTRNFRARHAGHKSQLRKGNHSNHKLQEAYNNPKDHCLVFFVIERCLPEALADREQFYIDLFRSVEKGFNVCTSSRNTSNMVWTEEQRKRSSAEKQGKIRGAYTNSRDYRFYSPEGKMVVVRGLLPFCKIHGLSDLCLRAVSGGKQSSHRGWRRFTGEPKIEPFLPVKKTLSEGARAKLEISVYGPRRKRPMPSQCRDGYYALFRGSSNPHLKDYEFVSPTGEVVRVHGLKPFCRQNGLNVRKMYGLIYGEKPQYKGWTLAHNLATEGCPDVPPRWLPFG